MHVHQEKCGFGEIRHKLNKTGQIALLIWHMTLSTTELYHNVLEGAMVPQIRCPKLIWEGASRLYANYQTKTYLHEEAQNMAGYDCRNVWSLGRFLSARPEVEGNWWNVAAGRH